MDELNHPVILFDGVCNLCNSSVQLIIKRDKKKVFRYASLQSNFGKQALKKFKLDEKKIDSIVLYENENILFKSTAVLKIAHKLGGIYSAAYAFVVIPLFIRDYIYDFIARNRYRWFGKQESCMVPSPELKNLFIDYK